MSSHADDLDGQIVLKNLVKQQRARAVLERSGAMGEGTLLALSGGCVAGAATFFIERSSIPESLMSIAVGAVVAIVMIVIGQWRLERRLEAVIELLKLDDTEALK